MIHPFHHIPAHLLTDVTIHRICGTFNDKGVYEKKVTVHTQKCFIEPLEETSSLEASGRSSSARFYIHSREELYDGFNFTRDVFVINHRSYAIEKLDAWPSLGYWCALVQHKPTRPVKAWEEANERVRRMITILLNAPSGTVCPAYQDAPRLSEPFISVHIEAIQQERPAVSYAHAQETLESQHLLRACVDFFNEETDRRAQKFFNALSSSTTQSLMTNAGMGLVSAHLPTKTAESSRVVFDFYFVDAFEMECEEISNMTYQVLYDNQ